MASSNRGAQGVKVFDTTVFEQLEDEINQFLNGDGTAADPQKQIVFPPAFFFSAGTFYCLIYYKII